MKEFLICLGTLGLGCFFLMREGKQFAAPIKREKPQSSSVAGILRMIKTNNTYPPLLEVLSDLQPNLKKKGIILHADMKGYMGNGEKVMTPALPGV